MDYDRRRFIQIAGLTTAVGITGSQNADSANETESTESHAVAQKAAGGGPQWAMVVNLKKCRKDKGCKACSMACNQTHNIPSTENPRHEIKWIWTEPYEETFPSQENHFAPDSLQHKQIPVLCNHCENPPCVRVCPTKATWKREDGIVMMDWHRCIGCRYCIAACPYGSRSFNWEDPRNSLKSITPDFPTRTKGVVEKCTFCEEKVAKGEKPACVSACPEGALVFGNLNDPNSEVRQLLRNNFSIRRKPGLGTQPKIYYLV